MLLLVPLESTKPAAGGEYPLCEAADEPGGPPPRYIAVTCGVCGTRISAGQEQAGQQVACPDCGTPCLVVLPVEADAVEAAAGRPVEEYAIREDGGDSAGGARIEEALIPVFCPLCHTLMQTPESLVGQQITCPDCGTATVVARPKVDKPKHQEQ
jgi:DNA-directed RNA polymerase subunit RPC12/RpoP